MKSSKNVRRLLAVLAVGAMLVGTAAASSTITKKMIEVN